MHHKVLLSQHSKAQSAMEYLMTYGWAILIIAVVLGALFELGVFSGTFFMPHVPPGSCHVFRPYGPRTVGSINLEGECQGALPQYAALFKGSGSIPAPASMLPNGNAPRTITAWVDPSSEGGNSGIFYYGGVNCVPDGALFGLILSGNSLYVWGSCNDYNTNVYIPLNKWSFVAVNYTGSTITAFYDGNATGNPVSYTSDACDSSECTSAYIGGAGGWWGGQFSGSIANVQVYNNSLSAQQIKSLYQEGIGGAPVNLQNLVGWWPLNGNANDYSGNDNSGTATGVSYTTNWESGYTQP